jgi:hypothetical protein
MSCILGNYVCRRITLAVMPRLWCPWDVVPYDVIYTSLDISGVPPSLVYTCYVCCRGIFLTPDEDTVVSKRRVGKI